MGFIIGETAISTWSYHLRELDKHGPKYSGATNLIALCGKKLGWDTKISLSTWGIKSHVPYKWCKKCQELACI